MSWSIATIEPSPPDETEPVDDEKEQQSERKKALAQLSNEGVRMILLGEQDRVAGIGAHNVREGDVIDGFRVLKITRDGVELVEAETAP